MVPAMQVTLLLYITSLNTKGITHSSILVHLAAIRNLHVEMGFGDINMSCPQIKQAMKAVKEAAPQAVTNPVTVIDKNVGYAGRR